MTVIVGAIGSDKTWVYRNVHSVYQCDSSEGACLVLRLLASVDVPRCDMHLIAKNYYIDNIIAD